MSTFTAGQKVRYPFQVPEASLTANDGLELTCPEDGAYDTLQVVIQKTITTGGTVSLLTPRGMVPGSAITIPNGATRGAVFTATVTRSADNAAAVRGERVSVFTAGFATAGAINGHLTVGTQNRPA